MKKTCTCLGCGAQMTPTRVEVPHGHSLSGPTWITEPGWECLVCGEAITEADAKLQGWTNEIN